MRRSGAFWKIGAYSAIVLGSVVMFGELYGFGPPHLGGQSRGFLNDLMDRVDTNKDGVVTQQEIEAFHKQRFVAADANGDGTLTQDEFLTAESRDDVRRQTRQSRMTNMFQSLDQNGDGLLNQAEAQTMATERFKRLDTNGDGKITQDEVQAKWRFGPR